MRSFALTYSTAAVPRIVNHNRSMVDDARTDAIEAAALELSRIFCANDVVKDDRAIRIPPQHLSFVVAVGQG